jgi:aldose sugar dehydrogenase
VALGDPWVYNEHIEAGNNRKLAIQLFRALLNPASVPRRADQLYQEFCSGCHGRDLEGGRGPSLTSSVLPHGADDASLFHSIHAGFPDSGMPGWSAALSAAEIRSLVIFLIERRSASPPQRTNRILPASAIASEQHRFRVESVAEGLEAPWSIAFLPDHRMLVTERPGRLRTIERDKRLSAPIEGVPQTRNFGEGGMLSVALHPDYARTGWVYLCFSDIRQETSGPEVALIQIVRGRIRNGRWSMVGSAGDLARAATVLSSRPQSFRRAARL